MSENQIFAEAQPAWAHEPEWGPAHLRDDTLMMKAIDLRDAAGDLPEDN